MALEGQLGALVALVDQDHSFLLEDEHQSRPWRQGSEMGKGSDGLHILHHFAGWFCLCVLVLFVRFVRLNLSSRFARPIPLL